MRQFKWVWKLFSCFDISTSGILSNANPMKGPNDLETSFHKLHFHRRQKFSNASMPQLNEFQSFFHLLIYLWVLFYLMEILRKAPIIWRQASLGYISIGDRDRRSMWGWDIKLQALHWVGGPIPTRNRIGEFIWNKHLYYVLWSIVQVGNTYILCLHRNIT